MKKVIFLVCAFIMLFALTANAQERVPTYSNTTNAADLDLWGGWDGVSMQNVLGDSGTVTDVLISGGGSTGGCIFSLNSGGCASGTHSDPNYKGFIDATELVIKYKSTKSMRAKLIVDFRIDKITYESKSVVMPDTNGQWSELVVPFSELEPDSNGKWIYNINGAYVTTNFNPVVELKLEGVDFGTTDTATISSITSNWYYEDMVSDVTIENVKPTYYQYYDNNFDYTQGIIKIKRGGSTEVSEELSLDDPRVTIKGFNSNNITNSLTMTAVILNKSVNFNISVIPFNPPTMTGITINSPKINYLVGEHLDLSNGTITALYSDKDEETIPLNDPNVTISGFNSSVPVNNQVITVSYGGHLATFNVNIIDFTVQGPIEVENPRRVYKVGDKFEWHTGTIVPTSGTPGKLFSRYATVDGFDSSTPVKDQVITVSYGGQTTTYTVDIVEDEAKTKQVKYYLEQTMQPDSKPDIWKWGSNFNLEVQDGKGEDGGPAIYATGDGTHGGGGAIVFTSSKCGGGNVTMSDGNVLSGFKGMDAIKIRYRCINESKYEMTFAWKLEYVDSSRNRTSGSIVLPSTNGEWVDKTILLSEFDKTDPAATDEDSLSAYDWLYNMKSTYTTDFDPYVEFRVNGKLEAGEYLSISNMKFLWYENDPVESISVTGAKTNYIQGKPFDNETGTVTINYRDGSTRNVKLKDVNVSGFDSSQLINDQDINVSYAGISTTYKVNISEATYNPNPIYTGQKFVSQDGLQISGFEGFDMVLAKILVNNPDPIAKQTYGELFVALYNGNKLASIKKFVMKEIQPNSTDELTVELTSNELNNATKIKIIALKDGNTLDNIFPNALEIGR